MRIKYICIAKCTLNDARNRLICDARENGYCEGLKNALGDKYQMVPFYTRSSNGNRCFASDAMKPNKGPSLLQHAPINTIAGIYGQVVKASGTNTLVAGSKAPARPHKYLVIVHKDKPHG